jgi:ribosome biogenesis protein NSA1
MRIITGDECGLLKESILELSRPLDGSSVSTQMGIARLDDPSDGFVMDRSRGIADLAFCQLYGNHNYDDHNDDDNNDDIIGEHEGTLSFCALRMDASIEKWEGFAPFQSKEDRICGGTFKLSDSIVNIFEDKSVEASYTGRPISLCSSHQYQTYTDSKIPNNIMAACSSMGCISIVDSNQLSKGIVAQYDVYAAKSSKTTISYTRGNIINRDIATAMAMSVDSQKLAVGGRERSTTMIDVQTGKQLWKAKNLPPNPQTQLQQPIWSTAIQFLSKTDTMSIGGSTDLLAVGTAFKQLQIYDIRENAVQRRPVLYTPEWDSNKENLLDHRITCLCQLDSHRIAVGDAAGFVHTLDMRKIQNNIGRSLSASVGRFTGPAGSIRQIVKHQSLPIIACVGMDRMLRTYDINKRKQLDCVYLKQRLTSLLFCPDGTWNSNNTENEGGSSDDSDDSERIDEDVEGGIDDEDEVQDYVDSSDEDNQDNLDASDEDSTETPVSDDGSEDDSHDDDDDEEQIMPETKKRRK